MRERTAQALAGSDLQYTLAFEPPAHMFLTEPGPLDELLSEAVQDVTGRTPTLSTDGGTSDARFIKDYLPGGRSSACSRRTIHKVDEHVAIADLEQLTAIYRRFLDLYFENPPTMSDRAPDRRVRFRHGRAHGDARAGGARCRTRRFVYLGDTARLPYGTKSAETVQAYAMQATQLLLAAGVKMVVIACNTASRRGARALTKRWRRCRSSA